MASLRPLDDRVVLKVLDAEEKSAGGILLPDTAKEKPQRGKVTAVGEGKFDKNGKRIKLDAKKGDVVLFGKYAGSDVKVDGDDYKVLRESENVIWFDFAALCEGPRSPADYIAIASEYQSVVISNVPVLHDTADNAARRFISVIDEFYDRGVKLIIAADVALDVLYAGEKLKFEFQRTRSRLTEMQSEEYLAKPHLS